MALGHKRGLSIAIVATLLLTACGSTPLSEREIVRAAFFGEGSVLLLLADEDASEGQPACKTAMGRGDTPARALQNAAESLAGSAFYGLMDAVGLPAGCDWQTAAEIGELLYDEGKPAPELSVFLLRGEENAGNAQQVYAGLKALEKSHGLHCGLQTLFVQNDLCALPVLEEKGYGFALLPKAGEPAVFPDAPAAQLAAVLCGQADRLDFTLANGAAHCRADAEATVQPGKEATTVQLHLRHLELVPLAGAESGAMAALRGELLAAFAELCGAVRQQGTDPFRLAFWAAVTYGPGTPPAAPRLELLLE